MAIEKWKVTFRLTLKTTVYFILDTEQECKDLKAKCLKQGIEATFNNTQTFYPAKRINEVIISKTYIDKK